MLHTFKHTSEWEGGVTHRRWGSAWFTLSDPPGFILVRGVSRDQTQFLSRGTSTFGAGSFSTGGSSLARRRGDQLPWLFEEHLQF